MNSDISSKSSATWIFAEGKSSASKIAALIAAYALRAAPVVAAIVALAVTVFAWSAVHSLFGRLGANTLERVLAGAASVGMLVVLVGVLVLGQARRLRALALIYLLAWLPLVVALVGLESAFRLVETRASGVFVPLAVTTSGGVIAALLAGLALIPVTTLFIAARGGVDDADERGALGYYVGNALKLVLLTATAGANVAFGLSQRVPLEVTIFVAVVLEVAFVLALIRSREGGPHRRALVVFGAAIALVAVETLSVLSGLASLPFLAEVGKALYLLTPAAGVLYVVAIALSERHRGRESSGAESGQVRIARPAPLRSLANRIRETRGDLAEVRAALAGGNQLPTTATVARDEMPMPEGAGEMSGSKHNHNVLLAIGAISREPTEDELREMQAELVSVPDSERFRDAVRRGYERADEAEHTHVVYQVGDGGGGWSFPRVDSWQRYVFGVRGARPARLLAICRPFSDAGAGAPASKS